jgi:hypothetical protein
VTAVPRDDRISELRDLFRHLSDFRATYEATGLEVITTPYGNDWSLWDLEYLYKVADQRLTLRQRQAITLCLVHGVKEADAAEMMGVSRTNPVMMYATLGLRNLLEMIDFGELERFGKAALRPDDVARMHETNLKELAAFVRSKVVEYRNCLLFPNRTPQPPKILLRSKTTYVGYTCVSPMEILWRAEVGPVPPGHKLLHSTVIPAASIACVNPQHGQLFKGVRS